MDRVYHTATDQRAEQSEAEASFLARLTAAGVPVVPQVKLGNNWVFDGAINGTQILVEYHGDYWHQRPEVKERDARKQVWADQEGYLIVTVWEAHDKADPAGEVARVAAIYREVRAFASKRVDESDTAPAVADRVWGDWRDAFLAQLAEGGIVREACIAAGVSRQTAYAARTASDEFAEAWRLALQDAADLALAEYRRRGLAQSDRAMEFFITTRDPELRPVSRVEHSGPNGGPIAINSAAQEAAAQELQAWRTEQIGMLSSLPNAVLTPPTPATTTE